MTTTFLNITNMKNQRSVHAVETTLEKTGFHPVMVFEGRAKITGKALSYKDIIRIKKRLMQKGFNLLSLSEIRDREN